jgi:hypothetical protein
MRDAPAPLVGQRLTVVAVFKSASPWPLAWARRGRAALLVGVASPQGELLADHLWVPWGRALAALGLKGGMRFELRGLVVRYRRADGSEDFSLADVRAARRLTSADPAGADMDLMAALRMRTRAAKGQADMADSLLTHVHRALSPTGRKLGPGDYLSSLLEARAYVWQLQQTLGEVDGFVKRLGTLPEEETES